jgi:hypothetical protein
LQSLGGCKILFWLNKSWCLNIDGWTKRIGGMVSQKTGGFASPEKVVSETRVPCQESHGPGGFERNMVALEPVRIRTELRHDLGPRAVAAHGLKNGLKKGWRQKMRVWIFTDFPGRKMTSRVCSCSFF